MLTPYVHLEDQLEAIARSLVDFEWLYRNQHNDDGTPLPPWKSNGKYKSNWDRLEERIQRYVGNAQWAFDKLTVRPTRSRHELIWWAATSHRSNVELLISAALHRLANLNGRLQPNATIGNRDQLWQSLANSTELPFLGVSWLNQHAVDASTELREAAMRTDPMDVEDDVYETTEEVFGPFVATIKDGEVWIETEVREDPPSASSATCDASAYTAFRSPTDWRTWLKSHHRPASESSWLEFKKACGGEDHPISGYKLVRFPLENLKREGLTAP